MTNIEKELLLKDLCARLPYGVICDNGITIGKLCGSDIDKLITKKSICVKPYLRPMSSMTEEEKKEYNKVMFQSERYEDDYAADVDWLNKHHFDYRGLIKKGLALEAPKGMY